MNTSSPPTREEVEKAIMAGIGYGLVPLSIRDHPEITLEYRTIKDRDGLVERITPKIMELLNR